MTETEWTNATDPEPMLDWLRQQGQLTERKARLFAVAVCRRIQQLLPDQRSQRAVEVAEHFADDRVNAKRLSTAARAAFEATKGPFGDTPLGQHGAYLHAAMAAWWLVNDAQTCDAGEVCNRAYGATVCDPDDPEVEEEA